MLIQTPEEKRVRRVPMFLKRLFASQLLKTRWFTKNVVTDKWFLQSHQKQLPVIGE